MKRTLEKLDNPFVLFGSLFFISTGLGVAFLSFMLFLGPPKTVPNAAKAPVVIVTKVPTAVVAEAETLYWDSHGVEYLTTSDELLSIRGQADRVRKLGQDTFGSIYLYTYSDYKYVIQFWDGAYRVFEIYKVK